MSDLISRQAAIDALDKRFDGIPMEQTQEILLLRRDLRTLPSAQPERKKGKWDDIGGIIRWGCPICHHAYETKYNFCPNCGAKMEVKND